MKLKFIVFTNIIRILKKLLWAYTSLQNKQHNFMLSRGALKYFTMTSNITMQMKITQTKH